MLDEQAGCQLQRSQCLLMSVIIQNTPTSNFNEIKLIRRVFTRNEKIWQKKISPCLAKCDINR